MNLCFFTYKTYLNRFNIVCPDSRLQPSKQRKYGTEFIAIRNHLI